MSARRGILAATVVLCAAATPAAASGDSTHRGGCGYSFAGTPLGSPTEITAVLDAEFVVYSPSAGNPVSATVTCTYVFFDRQWQPVATRAATFAGTGVVAGAEPVRVPADVHPGLVGVCESVDYTNDATPTHDECYGNALDTFPQPVIDVLAYALATTTTYDEACVALRAVAPLAAGGAQVHPDGDLFLSGRLWLDC